MDDRVERHLSFTGGFDVIKQKQHAAIAVCARARHVAYSYQMCANLDRKRMTSVGLLYVAVISGCFSGFPSLLSCSFILLSVPLSMFLSPTHSLPQQDSSSHAIVKLCLTAA